MALSDRGVCTLPARTQNSWWQSHSRMCLAALSPVFRKNPRFSMIFYMLHYVRKTKIKQTKTIFLQSGDLSPFQTWASELVIWGKRFGKKMLTADQRKASRLMLYLNSLNANNKSIFGSNRPEAKKYVRIESYLHPVQHRVCCVLPPSDVTFILRVRFTACYSIKTLEHDF